MNSLVDWWLEEVKFDNNTSELLKTDKEIDKFIPNKISQEDITNKLISLMPIKTGMNDRIFSFDECATNIINDLFKRYVDDYTLVLTTGSEHPSVVNNLNNCKNVKYIVNSDGLVNVDLNLKSYKRVFVYCIALSVGDSHYLPNLLISNLKSKIRNSGVEGIFVLDAVQELFLLPRDYSIYDYVIGTAHAIIPDFNSGILISDKKCNTSDKMLERGYTYYELLRIILSKREILEQFNFVMNEYFKPILLKDKNLSQSINGPYTFNLLDYKKRLYDLNEIDKLTVPDQYSPATFRACPAAIFQDRFMSKLKRVTARLSI